MPDAVSWIDETVDVKEFLTEEMREKVCRPDGTLHRLYQSLAPWPSAILPIHKFYQAILHAPDAPLDLHSAEFVATHVAILNKCAYARAHHGANYCATATNRGRAEQVLGALEHDDLDADILTVREKAIGQYTRKLTNEPQVMVQSDIKGLTQAGLRADEIVHVNQIAASFGYWTRMINGLGITLGEEDIGLTRNTLADIMEGQPDE